MCARQHTFLSIINLVIHTPLSLSASLFQLLKGWNKNKEKTCFVHSSTHPNTANRAEFIVLKFYRPVYLSNSKCTHKFFITRYLIGLKTVCHDHRINPYIRWLYFIPLVMSRLTKINESINEFNNINQSINWLFNELADVWFEIVIVECYNRQ